MKVEDQKALAKYIIENLKQTGALEIVGKAGFIELVSCKEEGLENAIYCAISSWNAEEIEKLMKELKKARESGEFYE